MSSKITTLPTKTLYTTSNPYESQIGYHRAIRRGPFIFVSGTTSISPSTQKLQHPGNAFAQTVEAFEESLRAVVALGGTKADVVRVRMFVGRPSDCDAVGQGFSRIFGPDREGGEGDGVGCTATMLVIGDGGFVDSEMMVEVEVDAIVV